MGLGTLLRRRLFTHPVALVAVLTAVVMSMTVVATLQLLSRDLADASVRTTLDVPAKDRTVAVSASLKPGQLAAADETIRAGLTAALGQPSISRVSLPTTRGIEGRAANDRAQLAEIAGLEEGSELTGGEWPGPVTADELSGVQPVPVALPESAARELGLSIGSSLVLKDLIQKTAQPVTVTLVGTYVPKDVGAPLWIDDPLSLVGVVRTDYTTYGPFVVGAGALDGGLLGSATTTWRVAGPVLGSEGELARARTTLAGETRALGKAIGTSAGTVAGEPQAPGHLANAVLQDRVGPLFDRATEATQRVRVALLTPTLLLILLGGAALIVAAGLLASMRSAEITLMRTRGASGAQLGLLATADAALLVLVGALGAALAAPLLAHWIGASSQIHVSGRSWTEMAASGALWGPLAVMAVLAVVVIGATTVRVGRAPSAPGRRSRMPAGVTALTGSAVDVVLVLLGVLGVFQLRRYAGANATAASAATSAGATVDPLTIAAPVFVIGGLAVLCLRLLPVIARAAARATERRPGFDLAWGGWQVARRLGEQSGTILLILLAMAMGTSALAQEATTARAIEDQSNFANGAAVRVVLASSQWPDAGLGGAMAEASGGADHVLPVHRSVISLGPLEDITVLGVDTARAGSVMAPRDDALGGQSWPSLTSAMTQERALGAGIELPGAPSVLTVDVDFTPPSTAILPSAYSLPGEVFVRDGFGLVHSFSLGEVGVGRTTRVLQLPTAERALKGPLAFLGAYVHQPLYNAFQPFDLKDLKLSVAALSADATPITDLSGLAHHVTDDEAILMTAAAKGAVPALITREVATAAKVKVGDSMSVAVGQRTLPLTVAGIVESVPTARVATRGIVFDLPAALAAPATSGSTDRSVDLLPVQEWWLDPVDASSAVAVVTPQLKTGSTLISRATLVTQRATNPVNAGIGSAMLLVTGAALVLASVGFAAATAALSRTRRHENAVLLALGIPARRIGRTLLLERIGLAVATVLTGLGLGLASAYAVVPLIVSGDGHPAVPSIRVAVPWGRLALLVGGLIVVLGVVGLLVLRSASRHLARDLREGNS